MLINVNEINIFTEEETMYNSSILKKILEQLEHQNKMNETG